MGYKSLKRVIGETTLERKCRLLFGSCLTVFIFSAFFGVDRIAEQLVMSATRNKGRNMVSMMLVRAHDNRLVTAHKELSQSLLAEIDRDGEQIKYDLLVVDSDIELQQMKLRYLLGPGEKIPPNIEELIPDEAEEPSVGRGTEKLKMRNVDKLSDDEKAKLRKIVLNLKQDWELRRHETVEPEDVEDDKDRKRRKREPYIERPIPKRDEYQYFQPISWGQGCADCHLTPQAAGAIPASEGGPVRGNQQPFVVMQVTLPYGETAAAINRTRALLITVSILTVFTAMIALYVIIRVLVVKPLKHLRDVSDEVSQGKTEVRAELHTNDEFEELGSSYNRMLRHLTDTQSALRGANEDLDGKVDELAQLSMRLYEMNRLKNDFLANMSHELRTPLNSIIGFSEVLHGIESLTDKQKRYAQNIQKSGRVLLEMINDILDLAKIEAGKMDVRPTEFALDVIVSAQCDMVRSLTEEKNIDLDVDVPDGLPMVFQDQAKLQQILTNLLSNAIKFTPEGGRITVTARRDERGRLELSVADTGVGIADEDRDIIFEKFRQGPMAGGQDNLTREYSGTGLGLSILKELCILMNGEVTVESHLGIGSTFRVVIPWEHKEASQVGSSVASKLDELEQRQRFDLQKETIDESSGEAEAKNDLGERREAG